TLNVQAVLHALSLVGQGLLIPVLLDLPRTLSAAVLATFFAAAVGLTYSWRVRDRVSHLADMAFGMLTLGNFGMLFGWWIDAGFGPVHDCCDCLKIRSTAGMWLGMFVAGNLAMLLTRSQCPVRGNARASLLIAENFGMALGMGIGGWLFKGSAEGH